MSDKNNVEKNTATDILDDVRRVEKAARQQLLIKVIAKMKENALAMAKLKQETSTLLYEMGVSDEDAKRVIDFVNELPEAKLSEEHERQIRKEAKEFLRTKKDQVEKKLEESNYYPSLFHTNQAATGGLPMYYQDTSGLKYYTTTDSGVTLCNSENDQKLNLNV